MTLKELLTDKTWNEYGDMDVTNDCIDDMTCAWCGTTVTKAGAKHFAEALELKAEIDNVWGCPGIVVKIDHLEGYNRAWKKTKELFEAMAGYCGCEEYDLWFDDGIEDPLYMLTFEFNINGGWHADNLTNNGMGFSKDDAEYLLQDFTQRENIRNAQIIEMK